MEHGSVRNLEQIQESDVEGRTPRGATILLVALGGACIVFAGLALRGRRSTPAAGKADPLGELVTAQAKAPAGMARPADLTTRDVTFPALLSDEGAPTTALAAVKGGKPEGAIALNVRPDDPMQARMLGAPPSDGIGVPPPPTDRLPVVPLPLQQVPAQQVLEPSPIITRPRDSLTRAASDAAQLGNPSSDATSPPGHEGGYQLQVSSFRTQGEADQFASQLRARGHKAYVVEAHVPQRGTWYRVRIGPFSSQHAAASYRTGFEGREHVVPFIVPPPSKVDVK
jgi:cell division septation protein DedD